MRGECRQVRGDRGEVRGERCQVRGQLSQETQPPFRGGRVERPPRVNHSAVYQGPQ